MLTKQEIRQQILRAKANCPEEVCRTKSAQIFSLIEGASVFREARVILAYWSMPGEVYTHEAVERWTETRTVLLPVVRGARLELVRFDSASNLRPAPPFGIMEPVGEPFTAWNDIDLVIVPGVAFDTNNHRLGRGKGYYDTLLCTLKAHKTGVGFDFQLLDTVPAEAHDISMDEVIVA